MSEITFRDVEITPLQLENVAHSEIEILNLGNCQLSDAAANNLARILLKRDSKLRELSLKETKLGGTAQRLLFQAMRINPIIRKLSIASCGITDYEGQVAMFIGGNNYLKELDLSGNDLSQTAESISRYLYRNNTLTSVDLSNTNTGWCKSLLLSLSKHSSLRCINLSNSRCDNSKEVGEIILNCEALSILVVSGNPFANPHELVGKLLYSKSLTELNLSNCNISAADVSVLCNSCRSQNLPLISLNVSHNVVGDAMAEIFTISERFIYLNVAETGLTIDSCQAVCDFIQNNHSLGFLSLDNNCCLDSTTLSDTFMRSCEIPLKYLSLAGTGLSESGVVEVVYSLREYKRLQTLVLDDLCIHNNALVSILELLSGKNATRSLTCLSLSHNPIIDIPNVVNSLRVLLLQNPYLCSVYVSETLIRDSNTISRSTLGLPPAVGFTTSHTLPLDPLNNFCYFPSNEFLS